MTKTNAMKKYLFILGLFLCFSVALDAQLKLDFEAGSNFSKSIFKCDFEYIQNDQVKVEFGYYFGLIPRLDINERLTLNTSFQYSQEGFSIKEYDYMHRYRYIRLIPELESKIVNEQLSLSGGINVGYSFDKKLHRGGELFDLNERNFIYDLDFGFVLGAKYSFNRFLFSVRYNVGIRDITDARAHVHESRTDMRSDEVIQKNRNLQLGVGIRLIK